MAKWNASSETGILRKPMPKDKFEDLLVFGYACKIFRDDDKALYIDQGKHLIPWMGNNTLKIDRYDCRGALSDLTLHQASDHDGARWSGLSDSERRIELLCDEERYYALKYNEEELEMYQEEESKRLQQKGTEFHYNYDVPKNPEESEDIEDAKDQDEAFVPPSELNVPADMEVPKTIKEHARIEKTATFVSNQGPQMEILIKTKQADNSQFHFMNKDNSLYKYYNFLLTAIKSGQYKVQSEITTTPVHNMDDTNEQEDNDEHYLHPSLVTATVQPAQPPPLPTVTYKPSADCTYSQLVSRIQGTHSESATPPPPLPSQEASQGQMTYEQQQYYQQYYYAAQYYEYYKQVAQQYTEQNPGQSPNNAPQDAGSMPEQFYALCQNQSELHSILQSHAAYQQYIQQQQQSPNPYAQIASNLSQTQGAESYTGPISSVPNLNDISKAPILYTKPEPEPQPSSPLIGPQLPTIPQEVEQIKSTKMEEEEVIVKRPLLSLAQYGSDSEDDEEGEEEEGRESEEEGDIKTPDNDLKQIIDKMASYVSKNGKDFENIVKAKGDQRFQFLNAEHEFNPYYKMKLNELLNGIQANGIMDKPKEKKIIAPVSFSIKKPKEEMPKEIKSALPVEESDEEHETSVAVPVVTTPSTIAIPIPPATPPLPEVIPPASFTPPLKEAPTTILTHENDEDAISPEQVPENTDTGKPSDTDDLLEMIDITDDLEDNCVENSEKDQIQAAVMEKLALQMERKKKAAAFLKLKSTTSKIDTKTEKCTETSQKKVSKVVNKVMNKPDKMSDKSVRKSKKLKVNNDTNASDDKCTTKNTHVSENTKITKEPKPPKETIIEIINIEDSDLEEGEIKKHKKSKKKKSRKRKRSKSRHESKSKHESKSSRHRHKNKEHKKSKKRRKKTETYESDSSVSS